MLTSLPCVQITVTLLYRILVRAVNMRQQHTGMHIVHIACRDALRSL